MYAALLTGIRQASIINDCEYLLASNFTNSPLAAHACGLIIANIAFLPVVGASAVDLHIETEPGPDAE